jgi:hypothetical protein
VRLKMRSSGDLLASGQFSGRGIYPQMKQIERMGWSKLPCRGFGTGRR